MEGEKRFLGDSKTSSRDQRLKVECTWRKKDTNGNKMLYKLTLNLAYIMMKSKTNQIS